MNFIKKLFCKHKWKMIDRVYGDMKSYFSGFYKCDKCGKTKLM